MLNLNGRKILIVAEIKLKNLSIDHKHKSKFKMKIIGINKYSNLVTEDDDKYKFYVCFISFSYKEFQIFIPPPSPLHH